MTDENSLSFQLMLVGWAGRLLFLRLAGVCTAGEGDDFTFT